MLIMSLFSGVSDAIANFFRDFMWSIISTEITCVQSLINALVNGVLSFGILDNTWIKDGYTACIALMFIILPVKIIYEIIFALVRDDDNNLDINKKIAGAVVCCILAMSLSTVVPLANNLSINVSKAIIGQQYEDNSSVVSSSNSASNSSNTKDFAKELVIGTLCAFGGMERNNTIFSYVTNDEDEGMDIGAERFYEYITDPDEALKGYEGEPSEAKKRTSDGFFSKGIYNRWSFYYRWDTEGEGSTDGSDDWDLLGNYENDSSFTEVGRTSEEYGDKSIPSSKEEATKAYNYIEQHSGQYIWDFGYLGTIIGLAIFVILLFIITIEVAMRIIMIGFLYIIGPLACMSLTNYSNPQAFTVWKNSILGMFLVNVTQIFMLQFLMNIASDISKAGNNSTVIASIALYFGAFSAVIAMPKYVTSMIGGYEQGIMESLNQMKGTVGAAWGMTGGLLMGASRKVMGRHNDYTGHLTGGIRGAIAGNRNVSGERIGGFRNRVSTIRNSIFGSQSNRSRSAATGTTSNSVRTGGLLGNQGILNRGVNNMKSPNKTRRFIRGMGNFIGYRGSGPKNWS
ncbi:hypothetical protein H6A03_00970 [[Clostridium] spiroforme]|nr:hypothetical protein [Thomasclavelia spiroformis]